MSPAYTSLLFLSKISPTRMNKHISWLEFIPKQQTKPKCQMVSHAISIQHSSINANHLHFKGYFLLVKADMFPMLVKRS